MQRSSALAAASSAGASSLSPVSAATHTLSSSAGSIAVAPADLDWEKITRDRDKDWEMDQGKEKDRDRDRGPLGLGPGSTSSLACAGGTQPAVGKQSYLPSPPPVPPPVVFSRLGMLASLLLLAASAYAGLGLLQQQRVEQGVLAGHLGSPSGVRDTQLESGQHNADRQGPRTPQATRDYGFPGSMEYSLPWARQVVRASGHLLGLLQGRIDDTLQALSPAVRLLEQQEKDLKKGTTNTDAFGALSGWVLRLGHWVRLPSPEVLAALHEGAIPHQNSLLVQALQYQAREAAALSAAAAAAAAERNEELGEKVSPEVPGGRTTWEVKNKKKFFQPCAAEHANLDAILLKPHGCSPGERRYFYAGVWMDWAMLYAELSRPGGGGGHNYNDPVCVVACVDRPEPLCTRLHRAQPTATGSGAMEPPAHAESAAPGGATEEGALGLPCIHLFALRQQRNVSRDAKELAEVYEAEMPIPWAPPGAGKQGQGASATREEATKEFEEGQPVWDLSTGPWQGSVLNAGAGIGIASVFLAMQFPKSLIVSVEASPGAFKLLQHNCRPFRNTVTWNAMLWPPQLPPPPSPDGPGMEPQHSSEEQEPTARKIQVDKNGSPLLDGNFLLKVFGLKSFTVVRLDLRKGEAAEEYLFSRLHQAAMSPRSNGAAAPHLWPQLTWLHTAEVLVVYQLPLPEDYESQASVRFREQSRAFLHLTQEALAFAPVRLDPQMLRKGSHQDEDFPFVFVSQRTRKQ